MSNSRNAFISLLFALALCGCAHRPVTTTSNRAIPADSKTVTERALDLESRADVVIDYERSDRFQIQTPGQATRTSTTSERLAMAIANTTSKRSLAVVIIGKVMRHEFPEPQLRTKVDSLEASLKSQGFTQVVFQLASATGRSFYRE